MLTNVTIIVIHVMGSLIKVKYWGFPWGVYDFGYVLSWLRCTVVERRTFPVPRST